MLSLSLTVLLLLAADGYGQAIQEGQCNGAIPAQVNLVVSMIEGTWNQIERINNDMEVGQCSSTEYEVLDANNLRVINREVQNETEIFRNGTAVRSDSSGRFIVTYEGNVNYPYWVLATDYTNYALVYSCINLSNNTRAVYAWKFSRTTALGTAELTQINNVINLYIELSNATFTTVNHSAEACEVSGTSILTSSYLMIAATVFIVFRKSF